MAVSDIEILVDGEGLDLDDKVTFNQSFAPVTLLDPLNVGGRSNSNILKIRTSDTNLRLLGYPNLPSAPSRRFLSSIECQVLKSGIPIVKDGRIVVERVTQREIEIVVYSRNITLLDRLSDDLRLANIQTPLVSSLNIAEGPGDTDSFQWDFPTSVAKIEGGEWPLADYGELTQVFGLIELSRQFWSVPVHRIFKAIFEEAAGLTPVGDFIENNSLFNSMSLAFTNQDQIVDFTVNNDYHDVSINTAIEINDLTPIDNNLYQIIFDTVDADPGGNYNVVTGEYTAPSTATITFFIDILFSDIFVFFAGVKREHRVFIFSNLKGNVGSRTFETESLQTTRVTFETSPLTSFPGEVFTVRLEVENTAEGAADLIILAKPPGRWTSIYRTANAGFNSFINIKQNLPDLGQLEFIRIISSYFGLFFVTSENEFNLDVGDGEVLVLPFDQIALQRADALNVSNIVDLNRNISVDYHLTQLGQSNIYLYGGNETDQGLDSRVGSGTFEINDNTLDSSKVIVELPTAASVDVVIKDLDSQDFGIASIPRFTGTPAVEQTLNSNPRILIRTRVQNRRVELREGITNQQVSTDFYIHEFRQSTGSLSLAWDNILAIELDSVVATYRNGYYLDLNLFLTSTNIHKLSFTDLFYLTLEDDLLISDYYLPLFIRNFSDENTSTRVTLFPITVKSQFTIPILPETQAWVDAMGAAGYDVSEAERTAVNQYIFNALFGPAPWWDDAIIDGALIGGDNAAAVAIDFKLSGLITVDDDGGDPGVVAAGFRTINDAHIQLDLTGETIDEDNFFIEVYGTAEYNPTAGRGFLYGVDIGGNNSDFWGDIGTGAAAEFKMFNNASRINPGTYTVLASTVQGSRAGDHFFYKDSIEIDDDNVGGSNPFGANPIFIGGTNDGGLTLANQSDNGIGGCAVFDAGLTSAQINAQFTARAELMTSLGRDLLSQTEIFKNRILSAGGSISDLEVYACDQLLRFILSILPASDIAAIYPMIGGSEISCSFNLLDASAFRLEFFNTVGGDFAATGWTPNGVNSYADTGINPLMDFPSDNTNIGYYSRTAVGGGSTSGNVISCNGSDGANSRLRMVPTNASDEALGFAYDTASGLTIAGQTISTGLFTLNRGTSIQLRRDKVVLGTNSPVTGTRPDVSLYLGANNNNDTGANNFAVLECAGAYICKQNIGATSDRELMSDAWDVFNTTLNR